jgi:hypothetical protein
MSLVAVEMKRRTIIHDVISGNILNVKEYYCSVEEITRLGSLLPETISINQDNERVCYKIILFCLENN